MGLMAHTKLTKLLQAHCDEGQVLQAGIDHLLEHCERVSRSGGTHVTIADVRQYLQEGIERVV